MKGLSTVLERTPYPLAVELAVTAARRGSLSLQPWLQVCIRDVSSIGARAASPALLHCL